MVVTMTAQEREAAQQLHERLAATATGQRWERIFRVHEREVEGLLTIHADLREHVATALIVIGQACHTSADGSLEHGGPALEAARTALDDLVRLGSFELSRDARTMREELDDARARALLGRALG